MPELQQISTTDHETPLAEKIRQAKEHLDELRRAKKAADLRTARERRRAAGILEPTHHKAAVPKPEVAPHSEYLYGAEAIAKETGQTATQVYYWFGRGLYIDERGNPAVVKAGPRTLMAYKSRLRNLRPPSD
jgi:hypothetical protein